MCQSGCRTRCRSPRIKRRCFGAPHGMLLDLKKRIGVLLPRRKSVEIRYATRTWKGSKKHGKVDGRLPLYTMTSRVPSDLEKGQLLLYLAIASLCFAMVSNLVSLHCSCCSPSSVVLPDCLFDKEGTLLSPLSSPIIFQCLTKLSSLSLVVVLTRVVS
jgi:hypothetical protein